MKTGFTLLLDEASGNASAVRLRLTGEVLTLQRQGVVCVSGSSPGANHRTVTLRRQPVGGLGLSVKGGAEHGVPVVISKIFKDQAADQTGMLFTGDAILQVNGIHVENATHEEAVHLLRNAGSEVTITVEFLREAPSFLKLPLGSPESPSGHGGGASSPLFDSGLHLNGNPSNTAPPSPSSPIANEPKYEKHWLDSWSVPLSIARISRSQAGTETLRPHAFNVLALGVRSGMLQFSTAQETTDWLSAVATNIHDLMLQRVKMANNCCSPRDQVVHMGWVNERLEDADCSPTLTPKFLALKGSSVSTRDWACAEKTYSLWEVLFKAHESKTYPCSWRGDALRFTVDFASGFTCCDSRTQTILWSFRFSQLRGSSDDGKARLKLLFQHLHTRQVETKELEFQDLTAVLHCVHAFLAAKVASWTPALRAARASAGSPRAAAERSVKDEN